MRYLPFLVQRALLGGLLALLLPACTDPYLPTSVSAPPSYLTVDGFINSQGVSTFRLSRTYAIAATTAPPVETKATAYVEQENGPRYALAEGTTKGTYTTASLTLTPGQKYRLHLTTGGKEYASDYVPAKTTPPIDEVAWTAAADRLNISVSSHDPTNATQYYRWEYEETWEIGTPYAPAVEYVNNVIRPIVTPYPTQCWTTRRSPTVQLAKTTTLTQDVVDHYPMQQLASTAYPLLRKYSILVQQHALTREEYDYWELLRKNTEAIGSLFDPQPSQLTGNVHCLNDAAQLALGYVGAHSLAEKRIFISRAQLPATWRPLTNYESCYPPDTVKVGEEATFNVHRLYPIYPVYDKGFLLGYTAAILDCIDCRTRGTAIKPSFWQ